MDNDTILDTSGNRLGGTGNANGNFTGQVYTIDKTQPVMLNANSICGLNQVMISFSRPLEAASAQTAANYTLSGGATVTSATLLSDGRTVLLQTTALSPAGYTLTVSNVRDSFLNAIAPSSQIGFTFSGGVLAAGIRGTYYGQNGVQRAYFTGTPVSRIDATIDFNWANGTAGVSGIAGDDFSVRWIGFLRPPQTASYQLRTRSDDGVRLFLNNQNVIDNWTDHSVADDTSAAIPLNANVYYPVQMDFYERGGQAEAHLLRAQGAGAFSVVPNSDLFYCSVPPSVAPGAFNAFETSTASGSVAGVIKTKVAGTTFDLDIVALNAAKNAIQASFTGDVKLELLSNNGLPTAIDSNTNCPTNSSVISTIPSVNFAAANAGRKPNVTFPAVADVWKDVRVRISYPHTGTATVVSCSNDNFAIRPASLAAIVASDLNWNAAGTTRTLNNALPAGGGPVHKAGRPFTIRATAYSAATPATVTSNYQGSPMGVVSSCGPDLNLASSCTSLVGSLTLGSWTGSGGTVATSTATYSEVGSFHLQLYDDTFAEVDNKPNDADSSAAERSIPLSAQAIIGRFVPDHFVLGVHTQPQFRTFNDAACNARSFTYIGQRFRYAAVPVASISAHRFAASGPTKLRNYKGKLWKLSSADVVQSYASTGPVTLGTPEIGAVYITELSDGTAANDGTGRITINEDDTLNFVRNATAPQSPFDANIALTLNVQSTDGVAGIAETINASSPLVFDGGGTGIAFDSGKQFRYGILKLSNAHGSELLDLPVPLEAQFWNGTNFVLNAADNCTTVDASDIAMSNFQKSLAACETDATISGRLTAGRGRVVLSKPGQGNSGSVDLRINLETAAGTTSCVSGTPAAATSADQDYLSVKAGGANYDADPTARATFGIRKSGPVIYVREMYGN